MVPAGSRATLHNPVRSPQADFGTTSSEPTLKRNFRVPVNARIVAKISCGTAFLPSSVNGEGRGRHVAAVTAASRPRLWLASRWERRGRRLSKAQGNLCRRESPDAGGIDIRPVRGSRLQDVGPSHSQTRQRSRPAIPDDPAVVENFLKLGGRSALSGCPVGLSAHICRIQAGNIVAEINDPELDWGSSGR
jgi:hypothetical protein